MILNVILTVRPNYMDWQEVGIGKNVVYMLCVGILAMITLAIMESNLLKWLRRYTMKKLHNYGTQETVIEEEDKDVKIEREHVESKQVDYSDGLLIRYAFGAITVRAN